MSEVSTRSRWNILLPLLLATLGLIAWFELSAEPEDAEVASAVVRPRQAAGTAPAVQQGSTPAQDAEGERELRVERVARVAAPEAGSRGDDPFARLDWSPPAPPVAEPPPVIEAPPPPPPPPRPVAPPIPYTYFGMSIQDGRTVVFVTRQDRTFVLAQGEVIENRYRVEEIRPTEVVLTYIPLNERQVMMIGTAKP